MLCNLYECPSLPSMRLSHGKRSKSVHTTYREKRKLKLTVTQCMENTWSGHTLPTLRFAGLQCTMKKTSELLLNFNDISKLDPLRECEGLTGVQLHSICLIVKYNCQKRSFKVRVLTRQVPYTSKMNVHKPIIHHSPHQGCRRHISMGLLSKSYNPGVDCNPAGNDYESGEKCIKGGMQCC